jgi:hypothetical protein
VERVKVNQLQVYHPALEGEDLRREPASRARWNAAVRGMREAAQGGGLALEGAEEMGEGAPAPPGPCPFLGQEAWVLADGSFAPCPAPAAREGRLGDFGPAVGRPLAEVWEGAAYRSLEAGAHPACGVCAIRRPGGL